MNKKDCEHERVLPLYVRDQEHCQWFSTKKITGEMIHMCLKCGKIFTVKKAIVKKEYEEVEE